MDEADACETGIEGDPIRLAERRTLSFAKQKTRFGLLPGHDGFKPRIPYPDTSRPWSQVGIWPEITSLSLTVIPA